MFYGTKFYDSNLKTKGFVSDENYNLKSGRLTYLFSSSFNRVKSRKIYDFKKSRSMFSEEKKIILKTISK